MRRHLLNACALLLAAGFVTTVPAQVPITVQVINDTQVVDSAGRAHGHADASVFLLLNGQDIAPGALPGGQLPYYPFSASGIVTTPPGPMVVTSSALVTGQYSVGAASTPVVVTAATSTIAMSFSPATVAAANVSTWTINVPNGTTVAATLTQPFVATLPAGVTTVAPASSGSCVGVNVGPNQVTMATGTTVPAAGCTIVVSVQATGVTAPAVVTATTNMLQTNAAVIPASASLAVVASPSAVQMSVVPATFAVGTAATLTVALPNATSTAATLTSAFVVTLPNGLVIAPATVGGTCTGAAATTTTLTLPAGSSIPPNGCTLVVGTQSVSTAGPLSGFARAVDAGGRPLTAVSPYTGQTRPVYTFTVTSAASGNLYLSFKEPVAYPPAPTASSRVRFQMTEFTYSQFVTSNGDLSTIDLFGIPVEMQTFAPGDTTYRLALDRVTYYSSTRSLLKSFADVSANLKYAFMRTDGTQFDPATDSLDNFARIVGPTQFAAPGGAPVQWPAAAPAGYSGTWPPPAGSPWPYPSFADYLDTLVNGNYQFAASDNGTISSWTYDYTGSITGNRTSGYTISLTSTGTDPAITIPLPVQSTSTGGFDFLLYGVPQNCDTLQVAGKTCTSANVGTFTNSMYGWIQADVMSALNFGYMNGVADTGSPPKGQTTVWYGMPPVQYPFRQARTTNDGFYNPWAALIYNHSDAYGFAFADRAGRPSPDIGFPIGGTLRVWILPDERLDAPMPVVAAFGATSISLDWPVVPAADHYVVTWSPPYATASAIVPQVPAGTSAICNPGATREEPLGNGPMACYEIQGLTPGTPYTVTVRASNADGTQTSFEIPVYARTSGTPASPVPTAAANQQINLGISWKLPPGLPAAPAVNIAGTQYTYDAGNATWSASGPVAISVGVPPSMAALTVLPTQGCSAPCITPTLSSSTIASGGQTTLTLTLTNPAARGEITLPHGLTVTLPPGVTTAGQATTGCIGAAVGTNSIVFGAVQVSTTSSCTLSVPITSSIAGATVISVPATNTDDGTAPAASVALTVTGGASNISQAFFPPTIEHGANSGLLISLENTTGAPITLTAPFSDVMPAGVSILELAPQNTCPNVVLGPAGGPTNQLSMAAGTVIPAGGCAIGVYVTSTTPGAVVNVAGPLLTTATTYPTYAFPLEMRNGAQTIWAANLYMTFLGSPADFSMGPCGPADTCAGSGLTPTVSFDSLFAPNFLERQAQPLAVSGGSATAGPPFGGNMPSIGIPFTPVANKKAGRVAFPSP